MPKYQSTADFEHGRSDSTGVLLVNLGTPEAPTTASVRRFLKQFLSDPRVVELPRLLWWLILNGVILRIRPSRSAEAYSKVWTDDGSPLMLYSRQLTDRIRDNLEERAPGFFRVELGMTYGEPSVATAIDKLRGEGARRLLVLPLYPQYSGTTTASVFDAVTRKLSGVRWLPEMRFINQYHDAPNYVEALAASIREFWDEHGRGSHLMLSFHGVPRYTLEGGDPYHCQCQKTGRLLAETLGLAADEWTVGSGLSVISTEGVERLDVVCPGFSTDCLETLEEIAMQNAELFVESGGGSLRYIPCLNAREDHVSLLAGLIEQHSAGWSNMPDDPASKERALAMGANR